MILVDSSKYISWLRSGRNPIALLAAHAQAGEVVSCGIVRIGGLRSIVKPQVKEPLAEFFQLVPEVADLAWTGSVGEMITAAVTTSNEIKRFLRLRVTPLLPTWWRGLSRRPHQTLPTSCWAESAFGMTGEGVQPNVKRPVEVNTNEEENGLCLLPPPGTFVGNASMLRGRKSWCNGA